MFAICLNSLKHLSFSKKKKKKHLYLIHIFHLTCIDAENMILKTGKANLNHEIALRNNYYYRAKRK